MPPPLPSRRQVIGGLCALGVAGCGRSFSHLPQVDAVVIEKTQRKMYMVRGAESVATYDIDLGFEPSGHKLSEGDGRTPEGTYFIDRKNPGSSFHLSLGISYPNAADVARAEAAGVDPGGDIFIHGRPNGKYRKDDPDWTAGCIAVKNREIEEIYWMVPLGTPIFIRA